MKTQIVTLLLLLSASLPLRAQSTAFSYQGRLDAGGGPANGLYDFSFQVFDAASGGASIGGTVAANAVGVSNGLFVATLDFGSAPFTGPARWLQISVKTNGAGGFTLLNPRQQLTPTPYAIYAHSAASSGGLTLPYTGIASSAGPTFVISNSLYGNFGRMGTSDFGMEGISLSAVDYGVMGRNQPMGNYGALGLGDSGAFGTFFGGGNYGQLGTASYGVRGEAIGSVDQSGVIGRNVTSGNYGLLGHPGYGADGVAATASGAGTRGFHVSSGAWGKLGSGVDVEFDYGIGVEGSNGGNSANYAGYFSGEVRIVGNLCANSYNCISDRNQKANLKAVSPMEVLSKVAALPITRWNYKGFEEADHIGPMAQDFQAAFNLNADDKSIGLMDATGVALAAIQGLDQKLEAKCVENGLLQERLKRLEAIVAELSTKMTGGAQ